MKQSHNITLNFCIDTDKKSIEIIQEIVQYLTKQGVHVNEFNYTFLGE